jgi:hypothetical protein
MVFQLSASEACAIANAEDVIKRGEYIKIKDILISSGAFYTLHILGLLSRGHTDTLYYTYYDDSFYLDRSTDTLYFNLDGHNDMPF